MMRYNEDWHQWLGCMHAYTELEHCYMVSGYFIWVEWYDECGGWNKIGCNKGMKLNVM